MAAIQVQIQVLLAATEKTENAEREVMESNIGLHIEVAKPAIFNREVGKVGEFVIMCKLYLRMKMRKTIVEEQVF